MKQIKINEIYGKKIVDWYFDWEYITLEFIDETFCVLYYSFSHEDNLGMWRDFPVEHMIDDKGYIKDEYASTYFKLNSNGDGFEALDVMLGLSMCNIVKCNLDTLKVIAKKDKEKKKFQQKLSFIELANEFGIKLTEEQSEILYKQVNGEE